jgi:hypothetical protein
LYLELQHERYHPEQTICVANAGLHKVKIHPPLATDVYLQNVRDYQTRLLLLNHHHRHHHHCSTLIWISLSVVLENNTKDMMPQRNDWIERWNAAVWKDMIMRNQQEEEGFIYFYLDVFAKSLHTKHYDTIHLDNDLYYRPSPNMFWSLMLLHQ